MVTLLDLPLPELADFQLGWTHFEFVAVAKEWTANKQPTVIPTLLRGKLIDYYAIRCYQESRIVESGPA